MVALQLSQAEITIRCCSEIVRRLLEAHDKGESVNLNSLKTQVAKKYGAKVTPRLVDIIAAVPQEVRDILLPKLRAKPVRTASGVRYPSLDHSTSMHSRRAAGSDILAGAHRAASYRLPSLLS